METVQAVPVRTKMMPEIADLFHMMYYGSEDSPLMTGTFWQGVPLWKNPMDMWMYQEIIHRNKPDYIIETGTYKGGSAAFMADMCYLVGKGKVISIDIADRVEGEAKRFNIQYIVEDSSKAYIANHLSQQFALKDKIMVVLDSNHTKEHVLKELDLYAPFVSKGQYLIVEDTNVGRQVAPLDSGPGPYEALQEWLPKHPEFKVDKTCEKFGLTFNPDGFLKRSFE